MFNEKSLASRETFIKSSAKAQSRIIETLEMFVLLFKNFNTDMNKVSLVSTFSNKKRYDLKTNFYLEQ